MSKSGASLEEQLRSCGEALAAAQEAECAARAEAARAIRLRDEFVSTVSHELRNPLNAIFGWSEVLRLRYGERETNLVEGLRAIDRAAHMQSRMITELLDIVGLLSGRSPLSMALVDARSVVSLAVDAAGQLARDKQMQVSQDLGPEPVWLMADAERLQQLLCLLLDNAIKFTPAAGQVRVTLEKGAGGVAISVSDDGAGIEPAHLPRLFDRFRPDQSLPRQRSSGMGLGLVRILAELHGGTVEAHSDGPGKGARFRVVLPVTAATESLGKPTLPSVTAAVPGLA